MTRPTANTAASSTGIAWNILRSHGDAEECVNDTYLRTWNAIPPARPSAFRAWLGRIVRNLSLDRWKQNRTAKRGGDGMEVLLGELEDCVPTPHGTEKALEDQEIAALISDFLRRLCQGAPGHLPAAVLVRAERGGDRGGAGLRPGEGEVLPSSAPGRPCGRILEQEEVLL